MRDEINSGTTELVLDNNLTTTKKVFNQKLKIVSIFTITAFIIASSFLWQKVGGKLLLKFELSKEYPSLKFDIKDPVTMTNGSAEFEIFQKTTKFPVYFTDSNSEAKGFFYMKRGEIKRTNWLYPKNNKTGYAENIPSSLKEETFSNLLKEFTRNDNRYFHRSYWLNYRYNNIDNIYQLKREGRFNGYKMGAYNGDNLLIVESIEPQIMKGENWDTAYYGDLRYSIYYLENDNNVKLVAKDIDYEKLVSDMAAYSRKKEAKGGSRDNDGFDLSAWLVAK